MRKLVLAMTAAILTLATSARAELPPFVSDTFDLYQLGSYQNPITYRYQVGWTDEAGVHYTFGNGTFYSNITFHEDGGTWTGPNELPWFSPEGGYTNVESVSMAADQRPFEHPVLFVGFDAAASTDRTWQVEWLAPSGELAFRHFVLGFASWASIDCVVCIFVAIKNALVGSL